MGHTEMLLAVAGLDDKALLDRTRRLASGDWSSFPPAEQVAYAFARKQAQTPWAVNRADADMLVRHFGSEAALDVIWQASRCNYMTKVADAFQLPLEKENQVYEIMIEEKAGSVTGPHLREVDPVTVDERNFRRFLASDMPANSVAIVDLPAPPPIRAIDPRYLVAITLVIGGSMVFALARALRRR
jgi:hypothetical protein